MCHKRVYLRPQGFVLHSLVSLLGPRTLHFFPPFDGFGLLHLRFLVCCPPPQVLLHLPHLPHLP